ncbi:serine hydrolase [Erythrobacter litoralis]|uniref:Beta-lactamase n=1 Tax=Erythrobacter litoralis (strain HTCC2594) TaxID=314225 RepID=Q2N5T1_ERYLH|nr:serine hydrolase [Erythrobacter litoralis]ABC64960.1 Beta-lactamase class A [Erythrobacter litoralis HTCC2594]
MKHPFFRTLSSVAAGALAFLASPAAADSPDLEAAFDRTFGTEVRAPQSFVARYDTPFEQRVAQLADGTDGRIGVYALDLSTGREIGVLADQPFPMASTSKVAIAAVYLAGVDAGKWSLSSEWRLPRPGGKYVPAKTLLDLMVSKSCNDCTDALLSAVGGPEAVNRWMRQAGISGFQLNRTIRTLINEDGRVDPASQIDHRDAATPRAMGQFLAGIHQGRWLSASSRRVLLDAMLGTTTGDRRMRSALPMSANLAHKTGTLSRTASDIGLFRTSDGRIIAAAIYVTGQSSSMSAENSNRGLKLAARRNRDARIASIANALYYGFDEGRRAHAVADYGGE